jgi:hypothetical protein
MARSFYRLRFFLLLLFTGSVFLPSAYAQDTVVKNLLILGDSHLKGYFGEFLHKRLHEAGKYNILSIGIGGAGSKNFVLQLQNKCCGYKIRISMAGEVIEGQIRVTERSEKYTGYPIAKEYGSDLDSVLLKWKPDAVIIALGSNYVNAHQELMDILENYQLDIPYVWVGPFLRKNVAIRYTAIEKVLRDNPHGFLVRSDDVVGHDTLSSAHFVGKTAQKWADTVVKRMTPYLERQLFRPDVSKLLR